MGGRFRRALLRHPPCRVGRSGAVHRDAGPAHGHPLLAGQPAAPGAGHPDTHRAALLHDGLETALAVLVTLVVARVPAAVLGRLAVAPLLAATHAETQRRV